MRQGRLVIFVVLGILIILSLGGIGLLVFLSRKPAPSGPASGAGPTAAPQATPVPTVAEVPILAAAQNLPRGRIIQPGDVITIPWPMNQLPLEVVTDTAKVAFLAKTRVLIPRGEPLLNSMLMFSREVAGDTILPIGSDAALEIPAGKVAISLPYDANNGVALGLKDGDHVVLIASWRVVDIDEAFQSVLPDNLGVIKVPKSVDDPGDQYDWGGTGPLPKITPIPGLEGSGFPVIPSEPQRYRLVTQVILKDALVLHMGTFGPNEPLVIEPTPLPPPPGTPASPVPPTPTPVPPTILTLVVTPQEALAINYLNRMMEKYPDAVQVTLALRSAGDASTDWGTDSVTQQYMFDSFGIQVPTKLDYGVWGTPVPSTPVPVKP
jgi:Flp pilus assembly protein CpaB